MIVIEAFDPGCARCQATKEASRRAMKAVAAETTLSHVSDPKEMARHRAFFTPVVRINGETRSTGPVPKMDETTEWLRAAAGAQA